MARLQVVTSTAAIEAFQAIEPDHIVPAHCAGDRFYDLARDAMGDK